MSKPTKKSSSHFGPEGGRPTQSEWSSMEPAADVVVDGRTYRKTYKYVNVVFACSADCSTYCLYKRCHELPGWTRECLDRQYFVYPTEDGS